MGKKTKAKKGFTLVEVTLVLAISALLVIGIMTGTSTSIARQRYTDAVNDTVEYLRQVYSEVVSVQNTRSGLSDIAYCSVSSAFDSAGNPQNAISSAAPGRTNCAFYGKLVTFGERDEDGKVGEAIHTYDIVGTIYSPDDFRDSKERASEENKSDDDLDFTRSTAVTEAQGFDASANIKTMKKIGANSVTFATVDSECGLSATGDTGTYNPMWGTTFETSGEERKPFRGALVIFRSPLSGTVHTYYTNYSDIGAETTDVPINIGYAVGQFGRVGGSCGKDTIRPFSDQRNKYLQAILADTSRLVTGDDESKDDLLICIGSDDAYYLNNKRRGIRILKNGRNATAIELLNFDTLRDGEDNPCR